MSRNLLKKNKDVSSRFGLKNDLDDRYNQRVKIYNAAEDEIKDIMKNILNKYADEDVVTKRSLEEYLIRELLLDYRNREGSL